MAWPCFFFLVFCRLAFMPLLIVTSCAQQDVAHSASGRRLHDGSRDAG